MSYDHYHMSSLVAGVFRLYRGLNEFKLSGANCASIKRARSVIFMQHQTVK